MATPAGVIAITNGLAQMMSRNLLEADPKIVVDDTNELAYFELMTPLGEMRVTVEHTK